MEPFISKEGRRIIDDPVEARRLMTNFYRSLGYKVIDPANPTEEEKKAAEEKQAREKAAQELVNKSKGFDL